MPDLLAAGLPLPVEAQSARQQADGAGSDSGWNQNDPFSRTDKWIGNPPQPSFEKWRDRESEVLNWAQYVADLSAWASQASLQFGTEILQASRSATLIHAFMEGVDIQEDWHSGWVETSQDGYGTGEVAYFAGCPWVRLHPLETLDRNTDEAEVSGSQQLSLSAIAGVPELTVSEKGYELPVYPLSRAAARELEQHRAQGHTPFHPGCVECARGRSVFSHRRRSQERLQCEIQADFCYLKSQGEILEDDQGLGNIKILVLTELVSNAVGYIVVTSDLKAVKKRISKWMELFGLASTSGATSVVLRTDAEQAVGDLISDCSEKISFLVRKANPQQHRSVGAAERAVRRLKESLGVLRADLNKSGVDLNFTPDSVAEALTYLALVHNHFGKTPSSDFSPLETVCGRLRMFMCREERWPIPRRAAFDAQENLQNLPVPLEEAVAFSHFVHRVLFGLGEIDEKEQVDIVLESDSSSALQLIGAVDLPRRSRHIDIKLTWLKERVSSNEVQLRHRAGTQNVADLFTKQDTQV
ncbi:unnamed protein product, partial [Durusdinium trenchii]